MCLISRLKTWVINVTTMKAVVVCCVWGEGGGQCVRLMGCLLRRMSSRADIRRYLLTGSVSFSSTSSTSSSVPWQLSSDPPGAVQSWGCWSGISPRAAVSHPGSSRHPSLLKIKLYTLCFEHLISQVKMLSVDHFANRKAKTLLRRDQVYAKERRKQLRF